MSDAQARTLWLKAARQWERVRVQKSTREATERLVLVGYGCSLKVEKGALVAYEGFSDHPAGRVHRTLWPGTHGLTSIIITGTVGTLTGDALVWCRTQGVSIMVLDRDGQAISYLTPPPKRDTELRQAQRALSDEGRMSLARWLIRLKLEGQLKTLREHAWLPRAAEGADYIRQCLAWWDIPGCGHLSTPERLTMHEANAAKSYFGAWAGYELPWRKSDIPHLPPHYRTFQSRNSPLTGTPMKAADPLNAMLNYCYAILLGDLRRVLLTDGFDIDLGLLHTDQHDALVYDVMEPLRPAVDALVLSLLRQSTLRYGDATPIPNGPQTGRLHIHTPSADGSCRLHPELLRTLSTVCRVPRRQLKARAGALLFRLRHGEALD